jgi:hypothetical protein
VALPKHEGIFAAIQRLPGFPANPVPDLVSHNCAQRNQEKQFCEAEVTGGRKNARSDQQGIARQEESHEKTCFNEDNYADQQRTAPLNQALNVKEEMKKMSEQSNHL